MGCWNGTCALSRLPIRWNDEVYYWFIAQSGYKNDAGNNFVYPWDHYRLMGYPVRAKYNDYGSIEDVFPEDQFLMDENIQYIKDELVEVEQGDNQYHDIAVKKDGFDFEIAKDAIHEGRLKIRGYDNTSVAVGAIMVHKKVMDDLMASHNYKNYECVNDEHNIWQYIDHNLATDIQVFAKKYKSHFEFDESEAGDSSDPNHAKVWRAIRKLRRLSSGDILRDCEGTTNMMSDMYEDGAEVNPALRQRALEAAAMNQVFHYLASRLRITISPQSGSGSQDAEYQLYQDLMGAMQNTITAELAEYDEDEEE